MESFGPVVFTGTETLHQPEGSDPPPKFVRLTEEQRQRVRTLRKDAYMTFAEIHDITGFSQKQIRRAINGPSGPPRRMGRPPKTPEQRAADKAAREAAKAAELVRLAEESSGEQSELQDGASPQQSTPQPTVASGARSEIPDLAAVVRHVRDFASTQCSAADPEPTAPPAAENQQEQISLDNPMEIDDDQESPPPQTPTAAPILPEPSHTITPAAQTQAPIPVAPPDSSTTNASSQSPTQSTEPQGPVSVPPSPAQTTNEPVIVPPTAPPGPAIPGYISNMAAGGFAMPFHQAQQHPPPPPPQRKKVFIVWCEMARSFGRQKPPTAMIGVYSTRNFASEHGARVIRQYCLNGKCKVPQPKWWVEERDLLEEGDPGIYWPSC
ncbi:hypothetical protein PspLS_04058 [Pyricularia sp. CBS 133598]|nr:hypothetical protein PspLS_04058 [Pyricularia sp. CBS 133598]